MDKFWVEAGIFFILGLLVGITWGKYEGLREGRMICAQTVAELMQSAIVKGLKEKEPPHANP